MRLLCLGAIILSVSSGLNYAFARPPYYRLVELAQEAPIIITGRVKAKEQNVAAIDVEEVIKGEVDMPEIHVLAKAKRVPPGPRFVVGGDVMLFLKTESILFTSDQQSVLDIRGSKRLSGMVEWYLLAVGNDGIKASDTALWLQDVLRDYDALSPPERRFLLQVVAQGVLTFPKRQVSRVLAIGAADTIAEVRWEALVAARDLGLVLEMKDVFLAGLRHSERRVRAVCFDALRERADNTFGYDPALPPEEQEKALADWDAWAARN